MSRVNNPRIALAKIPINTPQYKEHLERILEQLYARSGSGVSGIDLTNEQINSLQQLVNGFQAQIDVISNEQANAGLAINQLQNDLLAANSTITALQNAITNLETANALQAIDIADLVTRVAALEAAP